MISLASKRGVLSTKRDIKFIYQCLHIFDFTNWGLDVECWHNGLYYTAAAGYSNDIEAMYFSMWKHFQDTIWYIHVDLYNFVNFSLLFNMDNIILLVVYATLSSAHMHSIFKLFMFEGFMVQYSTKLLLWRCKRLTYMSELQYGNSTPRAAIWLCRIECVKKLQISELVTWNICYFISTARWSFS